MKLKEDLNDLKQEPDNSKVVAQAKKLGLNYVGFGRYEDPKTNQITHIIQGEKLVPFGRAIKSNTYQSENSDDLGKYAELMEPQFQELHDKLVSFYSADKYKDQELDAIQTFIQGGYAGVNDRLSALPSGIQSKQIEPSEMGDNHSDFIGWLDSALKKSRCPVEMFVYFKLGSEHEIEKFKKGQTFTAKSFRSGSINPVVVISAEAERKTSNSGRKSVYLMQVKVRKNNRGLYAADYSDSPEEGEFIFPRGTVFKVTGEPQKLVGSDAESETLNLEIYYLDCEIYK